MSRPSLGHVRLHVRVAPEVVQYLRDLAERLGCTTGEAVTWIVRAREAREASSILRDGDQSPT